MSGMLQILFTFFIKRQKFFKNCISIYENENTLLYLLYSLELFYIIITIINNIA